ncbi:hypothetical protein [Fundicoccus culcitae]|uniref:Uncharacterized protein n=1 Tax=Fundicoccus culcitae TaxID=2969821 RepID=A0ABY5P996_9LACT|nr:hypothetical protein [Fundicoccus culcitae]UUX35161.1 hypothetical protein NRE15_05835 [Fundicoccus culcitae]
MLGHQVVVLIKHYSIDLSTLTDSNKKKYMLGSRSWYLYLDNQYRNFVIKELEEKSLLPETKYSLIISIEDPDKEKNVYHDTISKLNQLNYIHSPIRTDIHIDVE